nr:bacteriorhodopsin [Subtercola boreus]
MRNNCVSVAWGATLTQAERQLVFYVLVVAALAFLAGLIRTAVTRNEIGSRYRSAVTARLAMLAVAFGSHLLILVTFLTSYDHDGVVWTPNDNAVNIFAARYMEWSVSVPLLCIELLAVCAVGGRQARRDQAVAVFASFAMVFCGFLGSMVIDDGTNAAEFIIWA